MPRRRREAARGGSTTYVCRARSAAPTTRMPSWRNRRQREREPVAREVASSLYRLDDEFPPRDELLVDVGLSRHDAELLSVVERDDLPTAPVRDSGHEPRWVARFAVTRDEQELEAVGHQ